MRFFASLRMTCVARKILRFSQHDRPDNCVGLGAINRPLRIRGSVPMMLKVNQINHNIAAWEPRILRIRATISGLDNPCIPFAILKHDPLPPFLRLRDMMPILEDCCSRGIYDASTQSQAYELGGINAAATPTMSELWQQAFAALNEEQRFFLYAWSASGKASPRTIEAAELIIGVATPGPHYKRWLTTGALCRQGEIVAWRAEIPMQLERECMIEIVLSEENMLRLSSSHPST